MCSSKGFINRTLCYVSFEVIYELFILTYLLTTITIDYVSVRNNRQWVLESTDELNRRYLQGNETLLHKSLHKTTEGLLL